MTTLLLSVNQCVCVCVCVCVYTCWVTQSCPTLCDPMDCNLPGSSARGILEWVAISFSGGSSWPGIKPSSLVSPALAGRFFTSEPPGKPQLNQYIMQIHWDPYGERPLIFTPSMSPLTLKNRQMHRGAEFMLVEITGSWGGLGRGHTWMEESVARLRGRKRGGWERPWPEGWGG